MAGELSIAKEGLLVRSQVPHPTMSLLTHPLPTHTIPDPQSINWASFTRRTRSEYRMQRISRYISRLHNTVPQQHDLPPLPPDPSGIQFDSIYKGPVTQTRDSAMYFQFRKNSRRAVCSLSHFQLRHLVKAVSKDVVYYAEDQNLMELRASVLSDELSEWGNENLAEIGEFGLLEEGLEERSDMGRTSGQDKITRYRQRLNTTVCCGRKRKLIDFATRGIVASSLGACNGIPDGSSTHVPSFVALGGFTGDLTIKNTLTNQIIHDQKISNTDNSIVNCIQFNRSPHRVQCVVSCNDSTVHLFDVHPNGAEAKSRFTFPSCINNAVLSPCGKYLLVAGDFNDIIVMDPVSEQEICRLKGHMHFSFGLSWHPHRLECATASQDKTTRIFDLRRTDQALNVLKSYLGPFRSLEYSGDGELLCAAESADMLHLYDTHTYQNEQQLDLFGEITGCSFTPDSSKLFVGIHDATYFSMLEFDRWKDGVASLRQSPVCDILL